MSDEKQTVEPITPSKGSEAVIQYSHFSFMKAKIEAEKGIREAEHEEQQKNRPQYFSRQL